MSAQDRSEGSQDDLARYVLGEMTLDEQIVFEVRMTENAELARAAMAAMTIDEHLSRAAAREAAAGRGRLRSRRGVARVLASAALLLLAIGAIVLLRQARPDVRTQLVAAVVPTPLRYEQLVTDLGLATTNAPLEAMRGAEAPVADGPARVDALLRAQQEQQQRAVAILASEVHGEAFVVPVTCARSLWVAVVGAFDDGRSQLYFPESPDGRLDPATGVLPPGTHVLPVSPATASAAQRERGVVAFAPGFVVPLGRTRVDVIVLALPSPPSADEWQRLRARVGRAGGDLQADLTGILPTASFRSFVVRTP